MYFPAPFLLHAIPEFLAWLARYNKWKHEQFEAFIEAQDAGYYDQPQQDNPKPSEQYRKSVRSYVLPYKLSQDMTLVRAFLLDMGIPILLGGAAIFFTVTAAIAPVGLVA